MESISPELALVDPELAERARALLPDVGSCLDLTERPVEAIPAPSPARRWISRESFGHVAAWLVIPSIALNIALLRTEPAAESVRAPTSAASSRPPTVAVTIPLRRPATAKPKAKPKRSGVEAARHVRTTRLPVAKRVLRWPASPASPGYDVIVWRGHRRITDVWTTKPKVTVAAVACRGGKALRAGRYLWFVYPLVDPSPRRFGRLVKWGQFEVGAGFRCGPHAVG